MCMQLGVHGVLVFLGYSTKACLHKQLLVDHTPEIQLLFSCACCCRLLLQENKKVQEISGNITKSIAGAF